jgi:hypothetical protein
MLERRLKCAEKYAGKCAHGLRTWEAVNPRQNWVSGGAPRPTTRPPRLRTVGGLRVVGLGAFLVRKLAGIYGNRELVQARIQVTSDLVVGEGEGLGRGKRRWLL